MSDSEITVEEFAARVERVRQRMTQIMRVSCCECIHESEINWNGGLTDLSGYCRHGDRYLSNHVNSHGIRQSLIAKRKCFGFDPKPASPQEG